MDAFLAVVLTGCFTLLAVALTGFFTLGGVALGPWISRGHRSEERLKRASAASVWCLLGNSTQNPAA